MANLQNKINNAINKGTNAATLAGNVTDQFTKMSNKFGQVATPAVSAAKPPRDTGIQSVSNFIAMMKEDGLARQNHYTFTFFPPIDANVDSTFNMTDARKIELLCSNCTLPGLNIGSSQHRTFGEQYDMPNDKSYGMLTSSFYVDNHFYVKKLFDRWSSLIVDPVSRTYGFHKNYVVDINLKVFDNYGLPHYSVDIKDAWPKGINDIQMSYENREFMKIDITWAYRYWTSSLISNTVHKFDEPVNSVPEPTIHERLIGYVGDFKDYQDRFNNLSGDLQRQKNMVKNKDWGGMVGQNFGGNLF